MAVWRKYGYEKQSYNQWILVTVAEKYGILKYKMSKLSHSAVNRHQIITCEWRERKFSELADCMKFKFGDSWHGQ